MAKPIFVLGKHRSGTTWLANQLCQHSQIAGITHERHEGIHESAYFTWIYNRYGDLDVLTNYMEFVQVMVASDYFQLADISEEFLYSLWPARYETVFRAVMDDYAARHNATHWIEKSPSHTFMAEKIAQYYPDAKFISIVRDVEAVVASMVARDFGSDGTKQARRRFIIATVISWAFYNKSVLHFSHKTDRLLQISYETLRTDLTGTLQQVCTFLEIPYVPELCQEAFVPNTSYQKVSRGQILSDAEKRLIKFIQSAIMLLPPSVMKMAHHLTENDNERSLPPWFFKLHPFFENITQSELSNSEAAIGKNGTTLKTTTAREIAQ